MNIRSRHWLPTVLVLAMVACCGCDLATLSYFLMPEPKMPPLCGVIASTDKKKEVKAMVLVYGQGLETRSEVVGADRQLAELLTKKLAEQYALNEELVTLVPQRKIEDFKSNHPEWRDLNPAEIGHLFKVDYVINLEINAISLYEKGHTMYRGQANVTASLVDVNHPDEPLGRSEVTCQYPSESKGGNFDIDSTLPPSKFRGDFLDKVAVRMVRYFAAHSSRDCYDID